MSNAVTPKEEKHPAVNMADAHCEVEITHAGDPEKLNLLLAAVPAIDGVSAVVSGDMLTIRVKASSVAEVRSIGDLVLAAMSEAEDSL